MLFLTNFALYNCFAELSDDPSKYINYESAVNPDYYAEHIQPFKLADYGYPVVHRKLGLSSGNSKIVYEGWLKMEFKDFRNFIDDYICMKKKLCTKKYNIQDILIKLKEENEVIQEEFMKALMDTDFLKTCRHMVDVVERYFDYGYHHYEHLKAMCSETNRLIVFLDYQNFAKIKQVINCVISILNVIDSYEGDPSDEKTQSMEH